MMHTTRTLYSMLNTNLAQINTHIETITEDLEKQIAVLPYPDSVTVYHMKNRDGSYVLTDMLVAKAQILSAMANLKAASEAKR